MSVEYGAAPLDLNLTVDLAKFLAELRFEDLPEGLVHEARRGILDWIGCALAGSTYDEADKMVDVLQAVTGSETSTVLGRNCKFGLLEAPIANGQMGHLLDYDDTHMGGVVLHTSGPVLAAQLAMADARPIDGKTLILGYVVGFEAGVRMGRTAPNHHDGGWHLTGTLGTTAAGAAIGRQIGLDPQKMTYALGCATTQASGMQQNRGTMCKSFHAGRAASNGLLGALMAEGGFDSSPEIIEGKRGFCHIYSAGQNTDALLENLGEEWILATNGYKPYACGIVQHPLIDASIALSKEHNIPAEKVAKIELRVNETAIRITGVEEPKTGLKSKFSYKHSAAVAYLDRTAGVAQYSDEKAVEPTVADLRKKITAEADTEFRRDQAEGTLTTTDGETFRVEIAHATGTAANPMSDAAIEEKFRANADMALAPAMVDQIVDAIWSLDSLDDVRKLNALCAG